MLTLSLAMYELDSVRPVPHRGQRCASNVSRIGKIEVNENWTYSVGVYAAF